MKLFEHLTEPELCALTEEEVQRYIDYRCAERGIPLLPEPPTPPPAQPPAVFQPDVDVYAVKFGWNLAIEYDDGETARRVLEAVKDTRPIQTRGFGNAGFERIEPLTGAWTMQVTRCFSEAAAAPIKPAADDHARIREEYNAARGEYDKIANDRQAHEQEIRYAIRAAQRREELRAVRRGQYQRYIDVAGGNIAIAKRFMLANYPDTAELLPDLPDRSTPLPDVEPDRQARAYEGGVVVADGDIPF